MSHSLHVVCHACGGINRVPATRRAEGGKCGRCAKPLVSSHPLAADEAGFERFVSRDERPILVDFWADWCGPCKMMAPAFAQAASQLAPQVLSLKVNTEQAQDLSARLNIRSIPTMALFWQGRELARQAGAMDAVSIVRWARQMLEEAGRA